MNKRHNVNVSRTMATMRQRAITAGRKPRRWEMNEAAAARLIYECDPNCCPDLAHKQFMGIPIAINHQDKSEDPRFSLIVDEQGTRRNGEITGIWFDEAGSLPQIVGIPTATPSE